MESFYNPTVYIVPSFLCELEDGPYCLAEFLAEVLVCSYGLWLFYPRRLAQATRMVCRVLQDELFLLVYAERLQFDI